MQSRRIPTRLKKFLSSVGLLDTITDALKDPRRPKGQKWSFRYLIRLLFTGALVQCSALKELEGLSEGLGPRVPDSTMSYTLERLDPTPLRRVLRAGVRKMLRSKVLTPDRLPFGVLAIDGKTSWVGEHQGDLEAQLQDARYNLRWMRAVLTSARSRPCVDQDVLPAETNEMGHFASFWKSLRSAYSRTNLFSLVTLDAGYTSKENAKIIDDDGIGYVLRVKNGQPTLMTELKRVLEPRMGQPLRSRHGRARRANRCSGV